MTLIRCIIVGTGFGAQHASWLSKMKGVSIDGLAYSTNEQKARELQVCYGIAEIGTDTRSMMLSGRYDLAIVVSPPDTHLDLMRAAVEAGIAVVTDKPLAETLDAATEIGRLVEETSKPTFTFFQWRLHPAIQGIREFIRSNGPETISHFEAEFHNDFLASPTTNWPWRHSAATAGAGALGDMGVHLFDLVRSVSGAEWLVKSAHAGVAHPVRTAGSTSVVCDADDFADVHLADRRSAKTARISVSRVAVGAARLSLRVLGSQGTAAFLLDLATGNGRVRVEQPGRDLLEENFDGNFNPYEEILPALQRSSQALDRYGPASIADGIAAQKLMDEAVHLGKL